MQKCLTLIRTQPTGGIAHDSLIEFEATILKDDRWAFKEGYREQICKIFRGVDRYLPLDFSPLTRAGATENTGVYFLTDLNLPKGFPHYHFGRGYRSLWMYDAWESRYPDIEDKIKRYNLNAVFFSAFQPATYFKSLDIPNFESHWVPEAINIDLYRSKVMRDRQIDVLQLGRKWGLLHEAIHQKCEASGFNYLFEKQPGEIIFESRNDFIEGLSNSKISICVPSSITHPERSGSVSTVTSRYYQAFASKCLVWGIAPDEVSHLFPYNPIVEIDLRDPFGQLNYILNHMDEYADLIDRNYQYVKDHHQWHHRVDQISQVLLKKQVIV